MKNDSKSGLYIYEIIATLFTVIIIASNTQFAFESNENNQKNSNIIHENTIRTIAPTSRFDIRRNIESDKYIKIEDIKISKDMDLSVRSGITKQDFIELLKNLKKDKSGFFYKNSETIYDLCEKYQLNEIFFCGLIAGESGWSISANHRTKCNYISMMYKGSLIKYDTPKEGLEAAAKLLHKSYLSEDGIYYSGKTLKDMQKMFCPDVSSWEDLIYSCMEQIIG